MNNYIKSKLKLESGIAPTRQELETVLLGAEKVTSSLIKKEDEHRDNLKAFIGIRADTYEVLSALCTYMNTQLLMIEEALKGSPTDKTYGYILDEIAVTTKTFDKTSKTVTKQHSTLSERYARFDFWDFPHDITDFEKELSDWVADMKDTVYAVARAIGKKDTFSVYKSNEDLIVLRSNSKYLKFYLEDNMPTQR